jgi:hypothetical protein
MLTSAFYTAVVSRLVGEAAAPGFAIAVGEGERAWDAAAPLEDRGVRRLVREVARRVVQPEAVVFTDAGGNPVGEPTARVRLHVVFPAGEGTGTLRECGLFIGATEEPGSGRLLSYHVHPRIEKGREASLRREVVLDLEPRPFAPGSRATRWLGNTRSGEVHDLDALTPNCQVDEIRFDRRFYFTSLEAATELGYDPCAYCLGDDGSSGSDGEQPADVPFDLGRLPPELRVRWPAPPRPAEREVVHGEGGEVRVERERTRLVVQADLERLVVAASDVEVEVAEGVRIGGVYVDRGTERIRLRGGRYGRIELAVPARFDASPPEYRAEWLVRDVTIDGVDVDSEAEDGAFLLRGRRIAVLRSRVRAERYAVWVGDTGDLQSEDVVIAGNDLRAAGAEATVRLVSVVRSAVVENRLSNPEKHNYRVHGRSDLAFAARNRLLDAGLMLASMEEDEIGAVWFVDNTIRHRTPSLLVVDRPAGSRLRRFVATGNAIRTDETDCFLCEPPPPGWTVRDNVLRPLSSGSLDT